MKFLIQRTQQFVRDTGLMDMQLNHAIVKFALVILSIFTVSKRQVIIPPPTPAKPRSAIRASFTVRTRQEDQLELRIRIKLTSIN